MKAKLTGTAQEERAGGVATDAAGNVYQALAAGGSVSGQPFAGDKDLVLDQASPNGTTLWTRELGTAGLERAYGVAIDPAGRRRRHRVHERAISTAAHAANTTDDVFVVKYDPDGNREWLRQFGVPAVADRGYAIATDATGNVYVTGYTRGNLAAHEPGRQGRLPRQARPERRSGLAAAVRERRRGQGLGRCRDRRRCPRRRHDLGSDGHARRSARRLGRPLRRRGQPVWLQQFGTTANEEVWGLTADAAGNTYVAAYSAGTSTARWRATRTSSWPGSMPPGP